MRKILIALAVATLVGACGGSSHSSTPTAAPERSPAAVRATPRASTPSSGSATPSVSGTPAPTRIAPGETVELTGVVGTITSATRTIQITRLSGPNVNQIEVQDSTRIRKADGGSETFALIRTSDRIIANGRINDRGDALVADQITVQPVVPGAEPGG
jgi:hypothetical protein